MAREEAGLWIGLHMCELTPLGKLQPVAAAPILTFPKKCRLCIGGLLSGRQRAAGKVSVTDVHCGNPGPPVDPSLVPLVAFYF